MNKVLQIISNLFHPMTIMTYAALMVCFLTPVAILPISIRLLMIAEVFGYTCLIPFVACLLLYKFKYIKDWKLRDRKERFVPLIISILCFMVCTFSLSNHRILPLWAMLPFYGSIIITFIALCVSFWWKISGHALGVSSLMTMAWSYYFMFQGSFMPLFVPLSLLILLGLICSIRVYFGRHTLPQVYVGSAVGIAVTLIVFSLIR